MLEALVKGDMYIQAVGYKPVEQNQVVNLQANPNSKVRIRFFAFSLESQESS